MATKKKAASKKKKSATRPVGTTIKEATQIEKALSDKTNLSIQKFMNVATGRIINYQKSFELLIPVATKCFGKVDKVKFNNLHPRYWGIQRLTTKNSLQTALIYAVESGNPEYLWKGVARFLLWLNDKKK